MDLRRILPLFCIGARTRNRPRDLIWDSNALGIGTLDVKANVPNFYPTAANVDPHGFRVSTPCGLDRFREGAVLVDRGCRF